MVSHHSPQSFPIAHWRQGAPSSRFFARSLPCLASPAAAQVTCLQMAIGQADYDALAAVNGAMTPIVCSGGAGVALWEGEGGGYNGREW